MNWHQNEYIPPQQKTTGLTLLEAVNTGLPFKGEDDLYWWMLVDTNKICELTAESISSPCLTSDATVSLEDALTTSWEVLEEAPAVQVPEEVKWGKTMEKAKELCEDIKEQAHTTEERSDACPCTFKGGLGHENESCVYYKKG